MSSMREIKLRIKSITETRQITKAMKLISAAKLKKARHQLEQTLPYFEKVKKTMAEILLHSGNIDSVYFDHREEKRVRRAGYIVITGDKTLAGGYNHNIIKLAENSIKSDSNSELFVAGQIGRNYFIRKKYNVNPDFEYSVQNPTVYRARDIAETVLDLFRKGELDEVYIIYTQMLSAIKQEPQIMKLLPLSIDVLKQELDIPENAVVKVDEDLSYEPSPEAVFDVLASKYVKGLVYGAFVEAFTSEQSARMTAMDNATANADEMLQALNLYYNRARQAVITQEISEIVGGAEALK